MPNPTTGAFTLALDFDGTLVEHGAEPLRWRPGAKEFLFGAAAAGLELWLHSCRCALVGYDEMPGDAEEFYRSGRLPSDVETSWRLREEMAAFLLAEGAAGLAKLWEAPGKPICDYYVDDKAEAPDWVALAAELGVRLAHVGSGQPPAVGPGTAAPVGVRLSPGASAPVGGPVAVVADAPAGLRLDPLG